MKAAVLTKIGAALSIEEVPVPEIEPHEVLVKTMACGICGTDVHIVQGWGYTPSLPHIPGHEPAGIVIRTGSQVRTWKPGDRVIPNIFQSCGRCEFCLRGCETICDNLTGITGVTVQGAFAEYFKAAESQLCMLPDEIDFVQGCVIADAVVTAVHAVKLANVRPLEKVAVFGVGGVGQNVISLAKHRRAFVTAIDVNENKLALAGQLGADRALLLHEQAVVEALKQCNAVFDCVGNKVTLGNILAHAGKGSRTILIGYEKEPVEISPQWFAQKEMLLRGSRSGTIRDTREAIQYVRRGVLSPHISDCFELEHINRAIQLVGGGEAMGRVVIVF